MIFEFGKKYIVGVTEKGIVPLMEFDRDRWFNKDHDDLDFLIDEEKAVVINDVLVKIRAEIETLNPVNYVYMSSYDGHRGASDMKDDVLAIIDKYK